MGHVGDIVDWTTKDLIKPAEITSLGSWKGIWRKHRHGHLFAPKVGPVYMKYQTTAWNIA